MALWGKSTSAESRPKWLGGDGSQGASGAKEDAFANTAGWALRAGTAAGGNDNTSAQVELLACVSGLATTLGVANVLSVDYTAGEYARTETFDMVMTFDEAITVVSAAWSADQVITNKLYFIVGNYGPTDMADDGSMKLQYYAGSGTNKITFRGTIPGTAVANGRIGDADYAFVANGTATIKDAAAVAVTLPVLAGGSATGGPGRDAEVMSNTVLKTGSTVYTEETVAGSSSGSAQCLIGVTTAVS
ncbi:uncharacterized protein METZ01_LOCUS200130 [marine metagenome]|uniref:Uncharacterized protein n=1 Tax=marine metagenome TaxID=408172 RepID=A0A382E911_9ZZZZ